MRVERFPKSFSLQKVGVAPPPFIQLSWLELHAVFSWIRFSCKTWLILLFLYQRQRIMTSYTRMVEILEHAPIYNLTTIPFMLRSWEYLESLPYNLQRDRRKRQLLFLVGLLNYLPHFCACASQNNFAFQYDHILALAINSAFDMSKILKRIHPLYV